MFSRILVPLDGSARAEQALSEAARLARATQGALILVRAVAPPPRYPATYVPAELAPNATYETFEEEANSYLLGVSQSSGVAGIPIECHVSVGPPAPLVIEAATEYAADLIVMNSHGRTGLARWVLGSVAQQVVRHAAIPVLVVRKRTDSGERATTGPVETSVPVAPASASGASAGETPPIRVLVPLDGSQVAEAVLQPAVEVARALAVTATNADQQGRGSTVAVHLLLVVPPYYAVADNQPFTLLIDGAKAYLAHRAELLSSAHPGVSVTWRVAVADDVAEAIVRVAEHGESAASPHGERLEGVGTDVSEASNLIAIATHGRTGVERWAMGSIAERVVATTSLPLLTVRPHTADRYGKTADQTAVSE